MAGAAAAKPHNSDVHPIVRPPDSRGCRGRCRSQKETPGCSICHNLPISSTALDFINDPAAACGKTQFGGLTLESSAGRSRFCRPLGRAMFALLGLTSERAVVTPLD